MPDAAKSAVAELLELSVLAGETAREQAVPIAAYANRALKTIQAGGKLLFCGNGGSAADAQHLAAEYVGRMAWLRQALPALALTTDASVLTAWANDAGFEEVFARQVEALARPGDLLVAHSTSGRSANVLRAAEQAREMGVAAVGVVSGDGGPLAKAVDVAVVVPTKRMARAQEMHLAIGHIVCRFVEQSIFGPILMQDIPWIRPPGRP